MKRSLVLLSLLLTSNAYSALPACVLDGAISWDNGLRYRCTSAGGKLVWSPATTNWRTVANNANFSVTSESRETLHVCNGVTAIALPSASTVGNGFSFGIKNTTATLITITPDGAQTIDGLASYQINYQYDAVELVSDGANWHVNYKFIPSSVGLWLRDLANQETYLANTGDQVGIGTTNPTSKLNVLDVLGADTGNEAVVIIDYTTNKGTSGNDTGLLINQVDTLSPGTSNLIDAQVSGVSKFSVTNLGQVRSAALLSLASTSALSIAGISGSTTNISSVQIPPASTAFTGSTGTQSALGVLPTWNQTSTAGATDLLINRTETAVGSGTQRLLDAKVNSVSKASIDNKGTLETEGGRILKVTNVNVATYDALPTDDVLNVSYTSTGAVTNLRLMTAQCNGTEDDGRRYIIKDAGFLSGTNNITITTEGAEKIDGDDTLVINSNKASVNLYCYTNNWYIY